MFEPSQISGFITQTLKHSKKSVVNDCQLKVKNTVLKPPDNQYYNTLMRKMTVS